MAKVERFEDLYIWKEARELCKKIFEISNQGTFSQDYTLVRPIRKASGSIMDNIAEGFEREGNREFIQFLSIAKGSAGEVRSQLYRAFDFGHIDEEIFNSSIQQVSKISGGISKFITYLKDSGWKGNKFSEPDIPYDTLEL